MQPTFVMAGLPYLCSVLDACGESYNKFRHHGRLNWSVTQHRSLNR